MFLLGLVPFLCWGGGVLIGRQRWRNHGFREAGVISALLVAAWTALGTELLSGLGQLRFSGVLLWWLILLVFIFWKIRWKLRSYSWPRGWRGPLVFVGGATGLILAVTFVGAFFAPPNNWDSLAYHLPRQVYWMQHGDVAVFPVSNQRQITMPPLVGVYGRESVHFVRR